jgi:hypothetical protein
MELATVVVLVLAERTMAAKMSGEIRRFPRR